jgi:hypothetical protein
VDVYTSHCFCLHCKFGRRLVSTNLNKEQSMCFRTVSKPHIPIRSLDDLANQTKILYGAIKGGSTSQFFQESKIASHVKMWDAMKNQVTPLLTTLTIPDVEGRLCWLKSGGRAEGFKPRLRLFNGIHFTRIRKGEYFFSRSY